MMVGMSDDLVMFLLARIGEDEEVALLPAPTDFEWRYDDRTETQWHTARCGYEMLEMMHPCECDVRARVLAECVAKRAVVALHRLGEAWDEPVGEIQGSCAECSYHSVSWPCPTVRALAAVYADHPDYDPAWAQ